MPAEKLKISEIITKSSKRDNPVLLRFQNGELASDSQDVSYFKAFDTRIGDKQLAVVATKTHVYQGTVNEDFSSSLVNKFLAIKNKKTGKVRLVQVDEASLLNSLYDKNESKIENQQALSAHSLMIKNFGGRRANRALERNDRMKVNVDVVKNQLEKTLEHAEIASDEETGSLNEINLNRIRPPFNAAAKNIDDVYKLNEIIPQELFDKMDEEANAILETKADKLPIASEYLIGKIKAVQDSYTPDSSLNLTSIKVFIYMDALQNLIKGRERKLNKANISNITEKVETDIRVRFSEPKMASLTKTRYTQDKALCYYLALALLTSPNYEINLNTLIQELSMSRPTIVKFAQLVNAKPVTKTDMLSLRLPSKCKNPSLFMGKRKRQ